MRLQPFLLQRVAAQSAGIALVRNVLKNHVFPEGYVTTRELYKIAIQETPPQDFEPFPVNVLGPQPTEPKKPKGKSPPHAKPRVLLSNRPEHPEHPVRSIRFLKEYILPHLAGNNEIAMKCIPKVRVEDPNAPPGVTKRITTSSAKWAWRIIPPELRPPPPGQPREKEIVGTEVGVGEDFSHLNKRRSRSRLAKLTKQVNLMKTYQPYIEERDKLLSKVENNPYTLKQVTKYMSDNPDADVASLASAERDARRGMPKRFWKQQPVEDEESQTELKRVRRHLAWDRPGTLNR